MGSCANKQIISSGSIPNKQGSSITKNTADNRQKILGICKNQKQQNSLLFNHSPLRASQFLFQKFRNSDGAPQQVSLGFMINQCKINIEDKQIILKYVTSSKSKIWCVYSGIQRISETGLTVQIKNYKYLQQIVIDQPSKQNQNNQFHKSIKCTQKPSENILIILQPLLENKQTIFMIYRYQILANQKQYTPITQTLQWSSLSFRINDIYGAEALFQCNSQNQVCSVCLIAISQCILLPCRHMCVCSTCLVQVEKMKPRCPLCRKQYYSVIKYQSGKQ